MVEISDRNTVIAIVALLLVVFAAALAFSNFRIAQSATNKDISASTYTFGDPEVNLRDKLYLHIEGDNLYVKEIRSSLTKVLKDEGVEVFVSEELKDKFDEQVLALGMIDKNIGYNPFTPNAEIEVLFAYFWDGNTSYFDEFLTGESVVVQLTHEGLIKQGTLSLRDKTRGIISYRAYIDHLATKAAEQIVNSIFEIQS
jgi:hypothetical protein